ncbi:MAG: SHOCT domain-containing protein [Theionarchaea archaeon]|nr:SHOCT domain-containing protein [Theionarchaea archaeon]
MNEAQEIEELQIHEVARGDKMRKIVVIVLMAVLMGSTVSIAESKDSTKVLVDESRAASVNTWLQFLLTYVGLPEETDWKYSFDNYDQTWGFGSAAKRVQEIADMDIRKKGTLGYPILRKYDVLIISSFEESYSSDEVAAIRQFVENGGGLLLLGDSESPNNSIARAFDVLFYSENVAVADSKAKKLQNSVHQPYTDDIKNHPITEGVEQVVLNFVVPLTNYKSGNVLIRSSEDSWADRHLTEGSGRKDGDEEGGPFDLFLAVDNIGKGRAVLFGGSWSFFNWVVEEPEQQNLDLLENAVKWLSEPGGPYKQYKALNEQAQGVLLEAVSLYRNHMFSQAKEKLEEAISIFEKSREVYPSGEANQGIEEAENFTLKCDTGMEADDIFEKAKGLYDQRDYENAIEEFEKARQLYEEIEYTEKVQECEIKVQESNNWITLREKAQSLYQQGEDALIIAPSTFDPTGYDTAKSIFEQAKSTWLEYDDPSQVQICEEKISLCNSEIANIKKNRMIVILGVVAVIAVVVLIVIVVIRIRKKKPQEKITPESEEASLTEEKVNALEALNSRYVKGEITKEEYETLRSVLEKK